MTACLCHGGLCEPSIRCSWPPLFGSTTLSKHRDFKGITEWSPKWHGHRWSIKSREMGQRFVGTVF